MSCSENTWSKEREGGNLAVELFITEEARILPSVSTLESGKFYVFIKAYARGGIIRSYYLHHDGLWHRSALPGGYFNSEESAKAALAEAMKETASPAFSVDLDAEVAIVRAEKQAWRA